MAPSLRLGNLTVPLNAGEFNRRISIRERTVGEYTDGQPLDTWTYVVCGIWAAIRGRTGMGAIVAANGDVPLSVTPYSFRIRYRPSVNAAMQVLEHGPDGEPDESNPFDIKAVQHDKDRREWTDLVCDQGASNG